MEPEKSLEELIEEITGEPLSLAVLRKIFDEPHLYSVKDFIRIITFNPAYFDSVLARTLVFEGAEPPHSDYLYFGFDLMENSCGTKGIHNIAEFTKDINLSLYRTLRLLSDEELEKVVKIGKKLSRIDEDIAEDYYSSVDSILNSKINFDKWVKFGKDIALLNAEKNPLWRSNYEAASARYFKHSKNVLESGADFFKWAEAGIELAKENATAGFVYFRASIPFLKSGIDFNRWLEKGKEILRVNKAVGIAYFDDSENALGCSIDFFKWAETGMDLAVALGEITGTDYFRNFKEVRQSGIDLVDWLDTGREIFKKNQEAGKGYFMNCCLFRKRAGQDDILKLIKKQANPDDYNFLRYDFKLQKYFLQRRIFRRKGDISRLSRRSLRGRSRSKLNELEAMDYLLSHEKEKTIRVDFAADYPVLYTDKLGGDITGFGRKLFEYFYFAVKNSTDTYALNYKDYEFKEVFDTIRGYSSNGKSLRRELLNLFKNNIGRRKVSEAKTEVFKKILDDVTEIRMGTLPHSVSDFFNYLRSHITNSNPFTKARLCTKENFRNELFSNFSLDSCTFGPSGSEREACLGYSVDPNIEMVFLSTYMLDKFQDNIGVAYLVNTEEEGTNETVWLLDGVDAGPIAKHLPGQDWKEMFYDGLIDIVKNSESPPDKLMMNVKLGAKKTPNEFLEYACKRREITYVKEGTRVKVAAGKKIITVLNKPLLSESNPEAYKAIGTNNAYLEAWFKSAGNAWNEGRGQVEVIELVDFRK